MKHLIPTLALAASIVAADMRAQSFRSVGADITVASMSSTDDRNTDELQLEVNPTPKPTETPLIHDALDEFELNGAPTDWAPELTSSPKADTSASAAADEFKDGLPAQDLSYKYVDARLTLGDLTGIAVEGAYRFGESWFGIAHLSYGVDGALSFTALSAGAGYRLPIDIGDDKALDLVFTGELELARLAFDVAGISFSTSEVGLRFRAGGRYRINEQWEVRAGLGFRTVFSGEALLDAAGEYHLNKRWSLVGRLEVGSDFTTISFGGRLNL